MVRARFAVMWVARELFGFSTPVIGRSLGNRDHSTVLNGIKRAEELREDDDDFREITDGLIAIFTPKLTRGG
jgi:chromosomal replication initiation ATPase DnaA